MTREEYESKLQDLQNQIEELKKVEFKKENKVWEPKNGEKYYGIYSDGDIFCETWADDNTSDNNCYMLGNCFKSEEEAEFEREKQIIRTKFKRYLKENDVVIDLKDGWYNLDFDTDSEKVDIVYHNLYITNDYRASNREILEDAIGFIGGKEVAKKYLFDYTGE